MQFNVDAFPSAIAAFGAAFYGSTDDLDLWQEDAKPHRSAELSGVQDGPAALASPKPQVYTSRRVSDTEILVERARQGSTVPAGVHPQAESSTAQRPSRRGTKTKRSKSNGKNPARFIDEKTTASSTPVPARDNSRTRTTQQGSPEGRFTSWPGAEPPQITPNSPSPSRSGTAHSAPRCVPGLAPSAGLSSSSALAPAASRGAYTAQHSAPNSAALVQPDLRQNSRKRTAPPTDAEDVAPPAPKRLRAVEGAAQQPPSAPHFAHDEEPVAGPSNHEAALDVSADEVDELRDEEDEQGAGPAVDDKRYRRTQELVYKTMVRGMPSHPCNHGGCQKEWNPYKYKENQKHLREHVPATVLGSSNTTACIFQGCDKMVPGTALLRHMLAEHIGLPYLCPEQCGWRSYQANRQGQHMRTTHRVPNWKQNPE